MVVPLRVFPENITGFGKPVQRKYDQMDLKCLLYEAARELQIGILLWEQATYPKNFHKIILEVKNKRIYCLIHEIYPYLAFQNEKGRYMDFPQLSVRLPSVTCLEAALLEEVFHTDYFTLNDQEKKQCAYCKPQTIGAVIFNCWD